VVAPQMPPRRAAPRPNYLLAVAVMALFGGGLVLSVALFIVLRIASSANNGPQNPGAVTATAAPVIAGQPTNTPAPSPTVGLDIQPWDGSQRLTILLLGLDKRPWEKGTAFRTDVMMLVSIDPKTKSIGMLSIPRDLFVTLPANTIVGNSYGLQRINSAYTIGELVKPGYGPQLAMQTVQYNLGMRINDYMVFEFNTVINFIDDIGGVDINVPYTINDPQYPDMYDGYDPLYISAGMTHMNGTLALKYARTRHQTSDFDRVKRQQQVMLAARDRILSANMIPTLITRAPDFWHQLSQTMHSDLNLDQLLQLAMYVKDVQTANIHQGVLDANYSSPTVYQGADVLVPERSKIGPLLQQIFGANYNG
jgi:LCP family protein required for cell wall assembly